MRQAPAEELEIDCEAVTNVAAPITPAPSAEIDAKKAIHIKADVDAISAPAKEIDAEKAICFTSDGSADAAPAEEIESNKTIQFANTVELENSKIVDLSDGRNIAVNRKSVLDDCIPTDIRINHFEKTRIQALLENVWLNKLYFRKKTKIGHSVNIEALPVESFNGRKDIKNGLISKLYKTATETLKKINTVSVSVGAPLESHVGGTVFGKKKVTSILKAKSEAADAGENIGLKVVAPVVSAEAYQTKATETESKSNIILTGSFAGIRFIQPVWLDPQLREYYPDIPAEWFEPSLTDDSLYIRSANSVSQESNNILVDLYHKATDLYIKSVNLVLRKDNDIRIDPYRKGSDLYIRSVNTVLQDNRAIWIDPWFAYEPPVQIDNILYVTEVIDVTINNNTAEVI